MLQLHVIREAGECILRGIVKPWSKSEFKFLSQQTPKLYKILDSCQALSPIFKSQIPNPGDWADNKNKK